MKNIWITSDTHFGHKNIIKYANRPFSSLEEMDELLISNWNYNIHKYDTVYFLGDFALANPIKYLSRLNGKIHMIAGNHDHSYKSIYEKHCESYKLMDIFNYYRRKITLCHYPMVSWPHMRTNGYLFHGHTHKDEVAIETNKINVCVDAWHFGPAHLDYILDYYKNSDLLPEI